MAHRVSTCGPAPYRWRVVSETSLSIRCVLAIFFPYNDHFDVSAAPMRSKGSSQMVFKVMFVHSNMILDKGLVTKTLEAAPGPLPWYGRSAGNRIYTQDLELEWACDEETRQSLLVERGTGEKLVAPVFGVGKPYLYSMSLSAERFVFWWQQRSRPGMEAIQFRVFDANRLHPFEGWRDAWDNKSDYLIAAPEIASFSISAELTDGAHRVALPEDFTVTDELLILVNRPATGIDICIWRIDPANGEITVLPQRWWNESDVDFGYQWITRVAREPASGLIVGDGIRISQFVLDASGLKLST